MTAPHESEWISGKNPALPAALQELARPVAGLWTSGDQRVLSHDSIRVGIIGSRHPRSDSLQHARRIARGATRAGCVIVSGLAIGIDGAAHEACLAAGGDTIAVLGGELGYVYPKRHRTLAQQIAGNATSAGVAPGHFANARGLVVSEYGCGEEAPHPYQFAERNRIIAALSDYLVVIQARPKSGSMRTAHDATELGIPIGIVPSAPDDDCYIGSTSLIRDGADCIVDDLTLLRQLEAHNIAAPGTADLLPTGIDTSHPFATILDVPRPIDDIADLAGLSLADTRMMLRELEADSAVTHTDDGCWVASS